MSNPMKQADAVVADGTNGPDGEEYARRFRIGDAQAFDGVVRTFQLRIFNLAYRILNNHEDAEEVTQEIFVKAHKSIGEFQGRCKFGTWLHAVAVNVCRNRLRQTKRRTVFEMCSFDGAEDPGQLPVEPATSREEAPAAQLERAELMKLVQKCISELPVDFSAVLVMRDVQGMSYEEVAEALGCSLGTVKSRLARGRQAVKEKLGPHLRQWNMP